MEIAPSGIRHGIEERLKHPSLVDRVGSGGISTDDIKIDDLPIYLRAASATGFRIEKIADAGEKYPARYYGTYIGKAGMRKEERRRRQHRYWVRDLTVREDHVGISIERPKGAKEDYTPFVNTLDSLRKQAQQPSSFPPVSK